MPAPVADVATRRARRGGFAGVLRGPHLRRPLAAICVVPLLAVLVLRDDAWSHVAAGVLVLDIGLHSLPWSLPRRNRGALGYWLEAACYHVPIAVLVLAGYYARQRWATTTPDSGWWYAAGGSGGVLLVALSGINLRALVGGDLAFLYGPTRASHASCRAASDVAGPWLEEPLYRGLAAGMPMSIASAASVTVAFVARHHLVAGLTNRQNARVFATEVAGAVLFVAVTAASGSIYPALLAHVINNVPPAILDLQVARTNNAMERSWIHKK